MNARNVSLCHSPDAACAQVLEPGTQEKAPGAAILLFFTHCDEQNAAPGHMQHLLYLFLLPFQTGI